MRQSWHRGAPPWWPAGEPWPPPNRGFGRHRRIRASYFRRLAIVAWVLMALAFSGVFALLRAAAARFALTSPILFMVFIAFVVAIGIFFSAMRRFAFPLRVVMDAADRVADGDYGVRVREHGPPPIRALVHSFNTMTGRLRDADRQRRDLLADVAHELRTPLTVLQGRLEGMLDGVYPRDQQQVAQALEDTRLLARLIEDLRTLSHAESGTLALSKEPTDLAILLADAAASMRAQADARQVAIDVRAAGDLPAVEIDPVRIREVVTNLLSNAVRYSPPGTSVVVETEADQANITIRVRDRGEGIAAEDLPHVFDRFHKGSASTGSGLGLTIARNLVAAHGGTLRADSRSGEGTTMTVALPSGTRNPEQT